jgi:hypothetical protein
MGGLEIPLRKQCTMGESSEPRTKYKEIKYFMYKMVVETLMNFSSKLSANNQHLNVTLMWPSVSREKREEIIKDVLFQRIAQNKYPLW